jgi:hypothetical protein
MLTANDWEVIATNLSRERWSWSCIPSIDADGRDIFVVEAQRDGKRFVVCADEKLIAFMELEAAIRGRQSAERIAERVKESSTNCRRAGKRFLDYVIRRFNLSSARLNRPQLLDLR